MQRLLIFIFLAIVASEGVTAAITPKDKDVRFTVHNLAYNPTDPTRGLTDDARNIRNSTGTADQVCAFCHTPHNATTAVPLWNRVSYDRPTDPYVLYTSSPTLSLATKQASITAKNESLLCLSCHDGKTAVNTVHNARSYDSQLDTDTYVLDVFGGTGDAFHMGDIGPGQAYLSNIGATRNSTNGNIVDSYAGTNLTDDHPIGFSYDAAINETDPIANTSKKNYKFNPAATAKGLGVRFFGSENRVECSSCHDPHVFYGYGKTASGRVDLQAQYGYSVSDQQRDRTPFLVRDNNGSALCLACHIK